ncbi:hypothetical protein B0H11DRAFT_2353375 [Mycena galericulata]|nr:hypothetical protein B0H11DRAFT_2353375 [Mycena galericulata]
MPDNTHPAPTIHEATAAIASLSLNPNISATEAVITTIPADTSTDTDSTGSCPDLVPASSSENSADDDTTMQHVTSVTRDITTAPANTNMEINRPRHVSYGYPGMANRGVQTDQNWRAPVYLAQRAFRVAFADRLHPQGFNYGPTGNHFRRGGAPYTTNGARAISPDVIHDLAMRLQHIERSVYALEQHWLPRHF